MRVLVRSVGIALVAAPVFAVAACQASAGTPSAAPATPSSASAFPSASSAPTEQAPAPSASAVVVVRTTPSRTRPASKPAARVLPDGKSQAFVLTVDATHRTATIRPMKMVSCVGESTCEDDYKIKITGPVTTVAIAPGATFAAAQDNAGTVCDATAPAHACARTLTQFATMTKDYQRKADLTIRSGAVVTMNEIFTP